MAGLRPGIPSITVSDTTPWSSITFVDHDIVEDNEKREGEPPLDRRKQSLEREISGDEQRAEEYGGSDFHDPIPSSQVSPAASLHDVVDSDLVLWDGPDDPCNPRNWSSKYKWFLTVVSSVMTVNVTFASSAPTSADSQIGRHFHVSPEVTYLTTSLFLFGYVFGPLFWGPGSELFGRKPIFIFAMVSYTLFILGQALASNIETLLVTRFLSGFFAVAPLTNCGGIIADIWDPVGRGPAISLFAASVFLGPVLGPIVSAYIVQSSLTWRWAFWVMFIFAGVCTLIMVFTLPETYAPVLLQKKAKRLRADGVHSSTLYAEHEKQDWSFKGVLHRTLYRPFYMLTMEPILVLVTIYLSLVYALLYAMFQAFPIIFTTIHHLTPAQTSLTFLSLGLGTTLGAALNFVMTRRSHTPAVIARWRGFAPPERWLWGAMIGGPGLVLGVFWLGWTGHYASVSFVAPLASGVLIGASVSLVFMSFYCYLIDTYGIYTASAFAANTIVRSAVAAAFPLFTVQMFTNLGVKWACTVLGLISLVLAPSPFLFYKYGARVRMRSRFAPCIDLKIADDLEREKTSHVASFVP